MSSFGQHVLRTTKPKVEREADEAIVAKAWVSSRCAGAPLDESRSLRECLRSGVLLWRLVETLKKDGRCVRMGSSPSPVDEGALSETSAKGTIARLRAYENCCAALKKLQELDVPAFGVDAHDMVNEASDDAHALSLIFAITLRAMRDEDGGAGSLDGGGGEVSRDRLLLWAKQDTRDHAAPEPEAAPILTMPILSLEDVNARASEGASEPVEARRGATETETETETAAAASSTGARGEVAPVEAEPQAPEVDADASSGEGAAPPVETGARASTALDDAAAAMRTLDPEKLLAVALAAGEIADEREALRSPKSPRNSSFRDWLLEFYTEHNPDKVRDWVGKG